MKAPIIMTITWNVDGSVNVVGPIKNKILSYGMLEAAKDAVRKYEIPHIKIPDEQLKNLLKEDL